LIAECERWLLCWESTSIDVSLRSLLLKSHNLKALKITKWFV